MDRQYTRIDSVRELLDHDLKEIPDEEQKRCAYVHLYGVGLAAAFLALKRGYDRTMAELAEVAGMLHDYATYVKNEEENHAEKSAVCAKAILERIDGFSEEDITLVTEAIFYHSRKKEIGAPFIELLKDADELQHFFRNPTEEYFLTKERTQKLCKEFDITINQDK